MHYCIFFVCFFLIKKHSYFRELWKKCFTGIFATKSFFFFKIVLKITCVCNQACSFAVNEANCEIRFSLTITWTTYEFLSLGKFSAYVKTKSRKTIHLSSDKKKLFLDWFSRACGKGGFLLFDKNNFINFDFSQMIEN